jgi:hypothetical protein
LKPVTQNEGLIYFYFVWSPDGSALAALAATFQEWRLFAVSSRRESRLNCLRLQGRPRLVEKNGRERRLDDNLTLVRPSGRPIRQKSAVALINRCGFTTQSANAPTQAAIPLRNQLA